MRLKFAVVSLLTGCLSSLSHAAVCPMPVAPQIPDGKTASGAEMLKAKKEMETYMAGIAEYLACDSTPIKQMRAQQKIDTIVKLYEEQMEFYKGKS